MFEHKGCNNCILFEIDCTPCLKCKYFGDEGIEDNWQPRLEVTDDTGTTFNKEIICPNCGKVIL